MKIEDQVKQLTDLMSELVPTVDQLAHQMVEMTEHTKMIKIELSETRISNIRLAEAIEKLVIRMDKIDQFEERLSKLEKTVFK